MVVFGGLRWVSVDSGQFRRDHRGRVLGFPEIDFLSIWGRNCRFGMFGKGLICLGERHWEKERVWERDTRVTPMDPGRMSRVK